MRETTALGAAIAAGFAIDIWRELDELAGLGRQGRTIFTPKIGRKEREAMVNRWEHAVRMCRGWIENHGVDAEEGD
jgi:glycerol kinase